MTATDFTLVVLFVLQIKEMLENPEAFAALAAPTETAAAAPVEAAKEEEKEADKDESDDDMGFGLFD